MTFASYADFAPPRTTCVVFARRNEIGGGSRAAVKQFITHRFALDDIGKAYDTFGNAAQERALKVLIAAAGA